MTPGASSTNPLQMLRDVVRKLSCLEVLTDSSPLEQCNSGETGQCASHSTFSGRHLLGASEFWSTADQVCPVRLDSPARLKMAEWFSRFFLEISETTLEGSILIPFFLCLDVRFLRFKVVKMLRPLL